MMPRPCVAPRRRSAAWLGRRACNAAASSRRGRDACQHEDMRPTTADALLDHLIDRADVVVPMANGEPVGLLDALEDGNERLAGVRIHQMHALHDRPYIRGVYGDRLRHVSYFLSEATREAFWAGQC